MPRSSPARRRRSVIYVGDAERDVQAARAAGMPSLVATYGYLADGENWQAWGGDGAIAAPADLLDWVGRARRAHERRRRLDLVLAAGIGGCLLGILAALLWRARREQASRMELEVLRARIRRTSPPPPSANSRSHARASSCRRCSASWPATA